MMWFAILAFAVACTALISVGAVAWLLISVTNAMQARAVTGGAHRELTRQ
ncbi:hypothetical protein [Nocardia sp. NPDC060259]